MPIAVSKRKEAKDEQNITKAQDLVDVPVKDASPIPKDLKDNIETENTRDKVSPKPTPKTLKKWKRYQFVILMPKQREYRNLLSTKSSNEAQKN